MDIARRKGFSEQKIQSLVLGGKSIAYRLKNFKIIYDYQTLINSQDTKHSDISTTISGRKFYLHSVCISSRCTTIAVFCSYIESREEFVNPLKKTITCYF